MSAVMEWVFGSAALVVFYFVAIQIAEMILKKPGEVIDIQKDLEQKRKFDEQIKRINEDLVDKRKAYEKKKEQLYEALKKRDDSGGNPPDGVS